MKTFLFGPEWTYLECLFHTEHTTHNIHPHYYNIAGLVAHYNQWACLHMDSLKIYNDNVWKTCLLIAPSEGAVNCCCVRFQWHSIAILYHVPFPLNTCNKIVVYHNMSLTSVWTGMDLPENIQWQYLDILADFLFCRSN